MKSQQNIIEQVFVSMRFGRKYSPGFIASRQGLNVSTVRACLARLVGGGVVTVEQAPSDKRRKLYISKQQSLQLWGNHE